MDLHAEATGEEGGEQYEDEGGEQYEGEAEVKGSVSKTTKSGYEVITSQPQEGYEVIQASQQGIGSKLDDGYVDIKAGSLSSQSGKSKKLCKPASIKEAQLKRGKRTRKRIAQYGNWSSVRNVGGTRRQSTAKSVAKSRRTVASKRGPKRSKTMRKKLARRRKRSA